MIIDFDKHKKRKNQNKRVSRPKTNKGGSTLIEKAAEIGNQEIEGLEEALNDFMNVLDNLAIAKSLELKNSVDDAIGVVIESVYKPIINAEKPNAISESEYNELRLTIFAEIIKHYGLVKEDD